MRTYEGEVLDLHNNEFFVDVEESLERGKISHTIHAQEASSFSTEQDAHNAISKLSSVDKTKHGIKLHSFKVEAIEYEYANFHGYSDATPFEIVRVISDKTIEIREMDAEKGEWKPEWISGGFAGHCVNQDKQVWNIKSNEANPVIRARLNKNGAWKSSYGKHHLSNSAIKFHDYNF